MNANIFGICAPPPCGRSHRHEVACTGRGVLHSRGPLLRRQIDIGILFSGSGSYALIPAASRRGALAGVAEVNADPDLDITFRPVERDPQGNPDAYAPLAEEILRGSGARHIIGCTTSWSRKEVIPALERLGGALWYPAPYEGFEASDHVVYTHACPNQHLLPLLDWVFAEHGRRGYLTGSNYIWGWEMNRLAREVIDLGGGDVLGERYLPLGETEVDRLIDEIRVLRPDFMLNNLIGPSQYAFLQAYAELGRRDPAFRPDRCPVLSCNLTECELSGIGPAAEGVVSAGPGFAGGDGSIAEASREAVLLLARLLAHRPGAEDLPLSQLVTQPQAAGLGIDPRTHHRALPVEIARVTDGRFAVLRRQPPVAGDPWLTRVRRAPARALRLVQ